MRPEWTQPTLSQEEVKKNGGVPPPPEPVRPAEFTVQLYNPDQQVVVKVKPGSWGGSTSYEFSLPQTTFRLPSASALDRTQDDPAASLNTPKLNFVWRKESKLSKDYVCYMTGRSTDQIVKKKNKEPDITVALYRSLREITIYEPNLYRVDLEDPKGLEEVLLLSTATIKDVYIQSNINETFNIQERPLRTAEAALPIRRKPSPAQGGQNASAPVANGAPVLPRRATGQTPSNPPPVPDARSQWELDAETARLRAQTEAEGIERQRRAETQRREKARQDDMETQRLRKMVEAEELEASQRQQAIDAETERLRRQYGAQQLPNTSQRPTATLPVPAPAPDHRPHSSHHPSAPARLGSNGLYQQSNPSAYASSSMVMSGANPAAIASSSSSSSQGQKMKPKKSFWGLRGSDEERPKTLSKKSSAMS